MIGKLQQWYRDWNMPAELRIGRVTIPIARFGELACVKTVLGYNPWRRAEFLRRLIRKYGWTRGAELGIAEGRTLFHLLRTCPALHMTGVDSFTSQYTGGPNDKWREIVTKQGAKYGERFTLISRTTTEAAPFVVDGSLDFVFIDADHSYEGVKNDILLWRPKLRDGGLLSGHDVGAKPVRSAVAEMCPGYQVWKHDGVWYQFVTRAEAVPEGEQ